jgi:hypothetical protein
LVAEYHRNKSEEEGFFDFFTLSERRTEKDKDFMEVF